MNLFFIFFNLLVFPALAATAIQITPAPRIGIKSVAGKKIFYQTLSGKEFRPKGYNYVIFESRGVEPICQVRVTTFDTNRYQAEQAEAMLAQLEFDGFNTVRTFIDTGDPCRQSAGQFSVTPPRPVGEEVYTGPNSYMSNVVDFLYRARAHNIYVILTMNYVPQSPYYLNLVESSPEPHNQISGEHRFLLTQGGQQAKSDYLKSFVRALRNYTTPTADLLSTVLAYDLQNELSVRENELPFSLQQGQVRFANGLFYNMGVASERQQAVDANVVEWANRVDRSVKSEDPQALTTASVFSFASVGMTGPNGILPTTSRSTEEHRHPIRISVLHKWSTLDYSDIHLYPIQRLPLVGGGYGPYDLTKDLISSEYFALDLSTSGKPIIMGEFGAFKSVYGCNIPNDVVKAADAMGSFRSQAKSLGFKGALYWTWNTVLPGSHNQCVDWWNAIDVGGAINGVLSRPEK